MGQPKYRAVAEQKQLLRKFDPVVGFQLLQPVLQLALFQSEIGTLTDKFIIANELPESHLRQGVQIPRTAPQGFFYGLLYAASGLALFGSLFFDGTEQLIDFVLIEMNAPKECNDLLFEVMHFETLLPTNDIALLVPTVVVHVEASIRIDLFLRGDAPSACATADQAGVREHVLFGPCGAGPAEQCLRLLELGDRDHRLLPAGIPLTVEENLAGIKRVG